MSIGYLNFLGSHPYSWGTLGVVLFVLGAGYLLPGFRFRRRRSRPQRRVALALYLWAAAVVCFVVVFFVPLRLRVLTETSLYYHAGLLGAAFALLWLRRVGLFVVFGLLLVAGFAVPRYHQTWNPLRQETQGALLRVLAVSSGTVCLELELDPGHRVGGEVRSGGPPKILGPIDLAGSVITFEVEVTELPDPLFFLGFTQGYRFLRLTALDDGGVRTDEWTPPDAGGPVPIIDAASSRRVETLNLRPVLMERYSIILQPGRDGVLSYKQL